MALLAASTTAGRLSDATPLPDRAPPRGHLRLRTEAAGVGLGGTPGDGPGRSVSSPAFGTAYPDERVHVLDYFSGFDDPEAATGLVAWATGEAACDEAGSSPRPGRPRTTQPCPRSSTRSVRRAGSSLSSGGTTSSSRPRGSGTAYRPGCSSSSRPTPTTRGWRHVIEGSCERRSTPMTRALVQRLGFDEACRESLAFLLEADPVECIHLALDRSGAAVGMVSGLADADRSRVRAVRRSAVRGPRPRLRASSCSRGRPGDSSTAVRLTLIADTDNQTSRWRAPSPTSAGRRPRRGSTWSAAGPLTGQSVRRRVRRGATPCAWPRRSRPHAPQGQPLDPGQELVDDHDARPAPRPPARGSSGCRTPTAGSCAGR